MRPPSTATQITQLYYRTLMSHSWSRHRAYKLERKNGTYAYYLR